MTDDDITIDDRADDLALYLGALVGAEPPGSLIEVRYKRPTGGMGQTWLPVEQPQVGFGAIRRLGRKTDTYVGCAPRVRRQGKRDAIERAHVAWVDVDSPEAIAALDHFEPEPSIVVDSGNGRHAYWSLYPPAGADAIERANRRLAHALGADPRATDAARILRPPGTFNHKRGEPKPVQIERVEPENVHTLAELVGHLRDPERFSLRNEISHRCEISTRVEDSSTDPLRAIPPAEYVERLSGHEVGRDGKIACPFHPDRTPSLHVYADPEQGWYCYGCGRGGTLYDFAAELWGMELRGDGFRELRRRLTDELLGVAA